MQLAEEEALIDVHRQQRERDDAYTVLEQHHRDAHDHKRETTLPPAQAPRAQRHHDKERRAGAYPAALFRDTYGERGQVEQETFALEMDSKQCEQDRNDIG
jgi:hypothetical protein